MNDYGVEATILKNQVAIMEALETLVSKQNAYISDMLNNRIYATNTMLERGYE